MNEMKLIHQEAENVLWDIGLQNTLIKGKKDHIKQMKPMMVDTDYLLPQIEKLETQKALYVVKYKDQLSQLNELINQV